MEKLNLKLTADSSSCLEITYPLEGGRGLDLPYSEPKRLTSRGECEGRCLRGRRAALPSSLGKDSLSRFEWPHLKGTCRFEQKRVRFRPASWLGFLAVPQIHIV